MLELLPLDILVNIVWLCDVESLCVLEATRKQYYELIHGNVPLWQEKCKYYGITLRDDGEWELPFIDILRYCATRKASATKAIRCMFDSPQYGIGRLMLQLAKANVYKEQWTAYEHQLGYTPQQMRQYIDRVFPNTKLDALVSSIANGLHRVHIKYISVLFIHIIYSVGYRINNLTKSKLFETILNPLKDAIGYAGDTSQTIDQWTKLYGKYDPLNYAPIPLNKRRRFNNITTTTTNQRFYDIENRSEFPYARTNKAKPGPFSLEYVTPYLQLNLVIGIHLFVVTIVNTNAQEAQHCQIKCRDKSSKHILVIPYRDYMRILQQNF
jgi:hypothetical protein